MLKRKREQKDYKLPNHEDVLFSLINDQALETIELYVRACPDILKIENEYGHTALMCALQLGHHGIADKLLDLAAEVNCTFPMVGYDFWEYVFDDSLPIEIANKIIDACADLSAVDDHQLDALMHALSLNHPSSQYILSKMIEKEIFNVNHRDSDGRTYLMFASRDYNEDVLELLIDKSQDLINAQDNQGRTALMVAALEMDECEVETVKLLVSWGADPDIRDNEGNNALMQIKDLPFPYPDRDIESKIHQMKADFTEAVNEGLSLLEENKCSILEGLADQVHGYYTQNPMLRTHQKAKNTPKNKNYMLDRLPQDVIQKMIGEYLSIYDITRLEKAVMSSIEELANKNTAEELLQISANVTEPVQEERQEDNSDNMPPLEIINAEGQCSLAGEVENINDAV